MGQMLLRKHHAFLNMVQFWLEPLNHWEGNCFLIGINSQCCLGFRAGLLVKVYGAWRDRESGQITNLLALCLPGEALLVAGDSAGLGSRIFILWPNKEILVTYGSWQSRKSSGSGRNSSPGAADVCKSVNKPEALLKGGKIISKAILSVFHQDNRPRNPVLPFWKGNNNNGRNGISCLLSQKGIISILEGNHVFGFSFNRAII